VTELLARSDVQAEIAKASKLAAKAAVEAAKAEAAQQAERAKMDEVERLRLEAQEAVAKVNAAEQVASEAIMERDLANALVTSDRRLQDSKALDYLRYQAFKAVSENDGMSMDVAVTKVLAEAPWLLQQADAAPATDPAAQPAPVERPTTAPPSKETTAPPAQKPAPGVDVLSMTRAEYEDYKRRQHNLH
jgi:hypothetical protein